VRREQSEKGAQQEGKEGEGEKGKKGRERRGEGEENTSFVDAMHKAWRTQEDT
jgi:hypothetical protein